MSKCAWYPYYGYEFADDVEGKVRTEFIKFLKFSKDLKSEPNLTQFIQRAIDNLHNKINLFDYNLVIMPQSSIGRKDLMVESI